MSNHGRFALQNRYQDSGWDYLGESCATADEATAKAQELSKDAICYGMVRVVDLATGAIVSTFSAGGKPI